MPCHTCAAGDVVRGSPAGLFGRCRLGSGQGTHLAVHSVELVVEGHGEVGGRAGGHVGDEGRLALADRVVHVHAPLADLHVLEARLHAAAGRHRNGLVSTRRR